MGGGSMGKGDPMTERVWFVFGGGGTGGHLFPALSVADVLSARCGGVDISFLCTQRPMDAELLRAAKVEAIPQSVRPIPSRPWQWPVCLLRWRESVGLCRKLFAERRPAAVVGAGGYASGPPVHAALRMGIPTFLLNPDAVPGRANRYLAKRQGLAGIFAQWEVTRAQLPATAPVMVTGCPVRRAFREVRRSDVPAIVQSFGLDPGRRTLLVTGASQGARTINEAMMRLAGTLNFAGWQVLHLTGPADADRVGAAYARAKSSLGMWRFHGRVLAFTERMAEAVAAADLIVSRAGASTLAEIIAAGKPSVLLPYPYHRDQHQRHNAMVLVSAGAALLVDDARNAEMNANRLGSVLAPVLADDARRAAMAEAARGLDRADSAERIADRLLSAVEHLSVRSPDGDLPAHPQALSRQTA